MMMYQKKSNRWMMLKALLVIPTMGFTLYAFATPEAMPEIKDVLDEKVSLPSKAQPTSKLEGEMQKTDAQGNLAENESALAVDNVDEVDTVKEGEEPTILPLEPTQEQVEYIVNNLEEPIEALVAGLESQPVNPRELNAGDRIMGRVIEMNTGGKSLTGVHVNQLDANGKVVAATVTDANGEFQILVIAPKNTLQFSLGGYDTAEYAMDADMYIGLVRQE